MPYMYFKSFANYFMGRNSKNDLPPDQQIDWHRRTITQGVVWDCMANSNWDFNEPHCAQVLSSEPSLMRWYEDCWVWSEIVSRNKKRRTPSDKSRCQWLACNQWCCEMSTGRLTWHNNCATIHGFIWDSKIHGLGKLVLAVAVMGLFTDEDFSFFSKLNVINLAPNVRCNSCKGTLQSSSVSLPPASATPVPLPPTAQLL